MNLLLEIVGHHTHARLRAEARGECVAVLCLLVDTGGIIKSLQVPVGEISWNGGSLSVMI